MPPLRPLIIDDEARAKVAKVIEHASKHHYRPGAGMPPPGDDPRFTVKLNTYRVVFSFTVNPGDGLLWRHLSISVPGPRFPNPAAAFMIAELFGFTGWDQRTIDRFPQEWIGQVNEQEHAVVVAQPVSVKPTQAVH
jgi:hypothetical protein